MKDNFVLTILCGKSFCMNSLNNKLVINPVLFERCKFLRKWFLDIIKSWAEWEAIGIMLEAGSVWRTERTTVANAYVGLKDLQYFLSLKVKVPEDLYWKLSIVNCVKYLLQTDFTFETIFFFESLDESIFIIYFFYIETSL